LASARVEPPKVDAGPKRREESSALVDMIVGRINALELNAARPLTKMAKARPQRRQMRR
jgi:hypothetical protein